MSTDNTTPALMSAERLAEIEATARQHRPGTDYAEHVPALIAEVERLRKEHEGARRAAASFKAWDLAGDVDRLTRELEAAEARAAAAEAKLAEATEIIRHADHVIIWEHDPCLPPDFQERIEAFLASLDKESTP